MRRFQILLPAVLAVASCLALAMPASAYPWGWGRYGYGAPYYGGYGYGARYYGGYGYGPGYYGGYYPGYAHYGHGYYPGFYGYSSGYYPGYGYAWNSYYPAYGYSSSYLVPSTYSYRPPDGVDPAMARSSTATTSQSLYPPAADDNTARVRVLVPADAQVWVDGHATTQTGDRREFTSPALDPNKSYAYEVKARWMKEGSPVEQTRRVKVRANQTATVDFSAAVPERDK